MEHIRDGWHTIFNDKVHCEVYVENGFIKYGVKYDLNKLLIISYPAHTYRYDKKNKTWMKKKVKLSTFRNGIRNADWKLS